jgi:aminoglycoside N3'-acetyltransferase
MLRRHIEVLEWVSGGRQLFFPSFNYDFLRTGVYRPEIDPSQVGPLTEHARVAWASWRTGPPVFNFVGKDRPLGYEQDGGLVDPFGRKSMFAVLHQSGGDVLLYGSTLATMTAIHYVERLSGGPLYRYDKQFPGTVRYPLGTKEVCLIYHCRPLGKTLDYDFPRLEVEAEAAGALRRVHAPGSQVCLVRFGALCDYWLEKLRADPLYLLDQTSRAWVASSLDRLGRRFQQTDFEGEDNG